MTTVHKNLTGADLHEPKGADTALSGQVYVSNGAGSGVWTAASSVVTNNAWSTGDTKFVMHGIPQTGWIFHTEGGTIGDGSSGASVRANSDTLALFTVLWNAFLNSQCPVSGGRGPNAAADFAAHKTITLFGMSGRVVGVCGAGSGLTARGFSAQLGTETQSLVTANLPPYTPIGSISFGSVINSIALSVSGGGTLIYSQNAGTALTAAFTGSPQGGTSAAFSIMQPSVFLNLMIKL